MAVKSLALVALTCAVLSPSCGVQSPATPPVQISTGSSAPAINLPLPAAFVYTYPAWRTPSTLVLTASKLTGPRRLILAETDGTVTPLTGFPDCGGGEYSAPALMANGDIAAVASCAGSPGEAAGPWSVVAIDSTTGHIVDTLVDPSFREIWAAAPDPVGGPMAIQVGFGPCSTIAQVSGHQIAPLDVTVGDGSASWNLRYGDDAAGACDPFGRAWSPARTPDGSQLAFFGSPRSIGVDGVARLDEPGNIYLLPRGGKTPRPILTDITEGSALEWSPDGTRLAFAGAPSGGTQGIYVFDLAAQSLTRVSAEWTGSLAWSPDGELLAVIRNTGQLGGPSRVALISAG
jgi:hypothetical protein